MANKNGSEVAYHKTDSEGVDYSSTYDSGDVADKALTGVPAKATKANLGRRQSGTVMDMGTKTDVTSDAYTPQTALDLQKKNAMKKGRSAKIISN